MDTTFSVGNTLGTGVRVWAKNVVPFVIIALLVYSPVLIWGVATAGGSHDNVASLQTGVRFETIGAALVLLLSYLLAAPITYGVVRELLGQRASLGACLATGFRRFFPVLGAAVLVMTCVLGGTLLLIIPGIIMSCMLYVAASAAVIERPSAMDALRRSRELTAGHRWEIFGILVLLSFANVALSKILEHVLVPHIADPRYLVETIQAFPKLIYANLALWVIVGSLQASFAAVAYYLLRSEKEDTTVSELAAVFD